MVATIDHALHRRQFVLDREPHKIHNAWVAVPLANGFTLSHCPELEVARALDADGRKWIMLGNAFDLDNEYRRAELSISRPPPRTSRAALIPIAIAGPPRRKTLPHQQ